MLLSGHVYCVVITFKMTQWAEQRICIKFCIKLEHSSAESIWKIQKAFGDDAVSAVQTWHKHFKHGQESVLSDPCSGRPATNRTPENVECECVGVGNCVRSQGARFEGDWGVIVLWTIFLVSCIFFNKFLFFSCYMGGYFLSRHGVCVFALLRFYTIEYDMPKCKFLFVLFYIYLV